MRQKVKTLIIGAGAGGLAAACWLRKKGYVMHDSDGEPVFNHDFMVAEYAKELPSNMHNGVHYLHSEPNLPFDTKLKRITLTDGVICDEEILHEPSLKHALEYSEKVREIQHPSSIMDIGKETSVFMPRDNSLNELMKDMYNYAGPENFEFGLALTKIDSEKKIAQFYNEAGLAVEIEYENIISTIPLDKLRGMIENEFVKNLQLKCVPVYITNYCVEKIVPNWMINLYVPDKNSPVYRASILNGICSVESIRELRESEMWQVRDLLSMFHLSDCKPEKFTWWTGKVISISIDERAKLDEEMSKLNIHLVGRFARWDRKLLVDSTINQAKEVVDKILNDNS
jgi:hypothetical protein